MSRYSRNLKSWTNQVVDDIFDNFDDYKDDDKQRVYKLLNKMKAVNETLEGYDNTEKPWYIKWLEAMNKTV